MCCCQWREKALSYSSDAILLFYEKLLFAITICAGPLLNDMMVRHVTMTVIRAARLEINISTTQPCILCFTGQIISNLCLFRHCLVIAE